MPYMAIKRSFNSPCKPRLSQHCHYCHSAMYGIFYVTEVPALALQPNGIGPVPYKVPCCKACHDRHEQDARNAKAVSKLTVVRGGQRGPA